MVDTCEGDNRPEEAYDQTTDAKWKFQCIFYDDQQDVFQCMEERTDYQKGKDQHNEQHQKGRDHKVKNCGNCFSQFLFQLTADDAGYKGGQDTS